MTNELQDLIETIAFLEQHQKSLVVGPQFPWAAIQHAKRHLNDQIQAYFKAEVAA